MRVPVLIRRGFGGRLFALFPGSAEGFEAAEMALTGRPGGYRKVGQDGFLTYLKYSKPAGKFDADAHEFWERLKARKRFARMELVAVHDADQLDLVLSELWELGQ